MKQIAAMKRYRPILETSSGLAMQQSDDGAFVLFSDAEHLKMDCSQYAGSAEFGVDSYFNALKLIKTLEQQLSAAEAERDRLRELTLTGIALFDMDEEANEVGTDSWVWLQHARAALDAGKEQGNG